jgi:hypothetical protein
LINASISLWRASALFFPDPRCVTTIGRPAVDCGPTANAIRLTGSAVVDGEPSASRHLLQSDDIGLQLGDDVDGTLQVVFVRAIDAVLDVERHHGERPGVFLFLILSLTRGRTR